MGTLTHGGGEHAEAVAPERAPFTLPRFALPPVPSLGQRETSPEPVAEPPRTRPVVTAAPPALPAPATFQGTPPPIDVVRQHLELPLQAPQHPGSPGFHRLARDLRSNAMLGLTVAIVTGVIALAIVLALVKMLHGEPPGQH